MANDTQGRFRVEIELIVDRESGKATGTYQNGMSEFKAGPLTLKAPGQGPSELSVSTDDQGNIHINVTTKARNGFQALGFPRAPQGPIEGMCVSLLLRITKLALMRVGLVPPFLPWKFTRIRMAKVLYKF